MVDLSKHLARAKQAIERRNYDLAIEVTLECQEVDPANLENYQLLLDAAKRKAKESGKKGMSLGLGGFSLKNDPHKILTGAVKKVAKTPEMKALCEAGDAAMKVYDSGSKSMVDVAILFYTEGKATGLHNAEMLWSLAHAHHKKFVDTRDPVVLDNAIKALGEFEAGGRSHPKFPEANKLLHAWQAEKSISFSNRGGAKSSDYRAEIKDTEAAQRAEAMNRIIRTREDALSVLKYVDQDLAKKPDDKAMWIKKGDVHRHQVLAQYDEAREAFLKAQALDQHDFVVSMRLGDLGIQAKKAEIATARAAGQDATALQAQLIELELTEYRSRIDRQPTEMSHHFNLASRLFQKGDIDAAAAEFQQTVKDPRYRRTSHSYLGHCFARKNLLDLARDQFTSCLSLIDDHLSDEYKEGLYNRARIAEALKRTPDAIADYTKVVEIDLSYKDAASRLNTLKGS